MPPEMRTSPPATRHRAAVAALEPAGAGHVAAEARDRAEHAHVASARCEVDAAAARDARGSAPVAVSVPALETSPPIETPPAPCTDDGRAGRVQVLRDDEPGGVDRRCRRTRRSCRPSRRRRRARRAPRGSRACRPRDWCRLRPCRSIAGEIATPPEAVIESERPFVQSLPFPPGMKQVCSCASGPMKTSVARDRRVAGEAHVAVEIQQAVADARPGA